MWPVAKVEFKDKIGLWRIVDKTTGKVAVTNDCKAIDLGGQRSEIDAWRLLNAHTDKVALERRLKLRERKPQ